MQLITYIDRLAKDLPTLHSLLENQLSGLLQGVHLLPFFDPIDGADAGFDPVDHASVDARMGTWHDVKRLSESYTIMADLIVNHMSANSRQFKDVIQQGQQSEFWDLFLKKEDVYGSRVDEQQLAQIYRPRPSKPFTQKRLDNGETHEFWTTFSSDQIDINVETQAGKQYLEDILKTFSEAGIKEVRLDAAGYAIKRLGTRCFMLPETFEFLQSLDQRCKALGMNTLVEIHSHYNMQIEIAQRVSSVYDFALPPLLLHALYNADAKPLVNWLTISPRNCVTVLDTHDGIGILDVAKDGDQPGLLNDDQVDNLVKGIHQQSNGQSRKASGEGASNLDIYQVNCTYLDALGRDMRDYLIARAVQFFAPGTPQIYYMGLLCGENDITLLSETGVGRDINRHYYQRSELDTAIQSDAVQSVFDLIRIRNRSKAFNGDFSVSAESQNQLQLSWLLNESRASLKVDFATKSVVIDLYENGGNERYELNGTGFVKQFSDKMN